MVQKRFSIALDIKRPTANRDFEVVEGDNGNVLEVTLTDDGAAVDLTGCRVCAIFSKSDGNTAQQDTDGHGIAVTLPNKLTISLYTTSVAPGLVECELQVYSGAEQTVLSTSAKFNFMCRRGIANDDTIEATDEWPMLVGMMQRVEAAENAELLRVSAEQGRAAAESLRAAAEAEREYAENARDQAEDARILAEQGRTASEIERNISEQARAAAETIRISSEAARVSAESARSAAETARMAQESSRAAAEAARAAAEEERVRRDAEYRRLEPYDPAASYVPLNKVTYEGSCYECIRAASGIVPTNTAYWSLIARAGEGSGDMLKATYDADNDGVVDDAAKLGGQVPSYYATAAHTHTPAQVGAAAAAVQYTGVLLATDWAGTGPWTQTISVPGITAAMVPFVDMVMYDDIYNQMRLEAYSCLDRITTGAGTVTAYCYREKPTNDIGLRLRVVQ